MANEKYEPKPGDVVRLKSGGPRMTIASSNVTFSTEVWACQWFSGDELRTGDFAPEALEVATEPKAPAMAGGSDTRWGDDGNRGFG